ncbi:MAG: hypothetical protein RJB62_545 [Pseudomonadota bacterium]|jgi:hypothetical protein
MTPSVKPFSKNEYARMADDLETMGEAIRKHPDMNHHFAERLALLSKQMREDCIRVYPAESR